MRILANENFPSDAVEALQARGHDVAWVRADAPGSRDPQVLARAQAEGRILVTSDDIDTSLARTDPSRLHQLCRPPTCRLPKRGKRQVGHSCISVNVVCRWRASV